MRDADRRLLLKIIRRQIIILLGAERVKIAPDILRTAEKVAALLRSRLLFLFRGQSERKSGDGRKEPHKPCGFGENSN